jgi:hypothetical protein
MHNFGRPGSNAPPHMPVCLPMKHAVEGSVPHPDEQKKWEESLCTHTLASPTGCKASFIVLKNADHYLLRLDYPT